MKKFYMLLFALTLLSCEDNSNPDVLTNANRFFSLYKGRTDWQGFQDLYAQEAVFEDVVFRYSFNKDGFIAFYNWPDPLLQKHPNFPEALVLEELIVQGNTAVGSGYFNPFYYDDVLYDDIEHMRFTMWLKFNSEGLIISHTDWIEYPPEFVIGAMQKFVEVDSTSN